MSEYGDEDDGYDSNGEMKEPVASSSQAGDEKVTLDDLLDRLESLENENDELFESNKKLKTMNEGLQQNLKKLVAVKADLEDEVDELSDLIKDLKYVFPGDRRFFFFLLIKNQNSPLYFYSL